MRSEVVLFLLLFFFFFFDAELMRIDWYSWILVEVPFCFALLCFGCGCDCDYGYD